MRAVDGVKAFMATWIKPGHRGKRGLQIRTVTPERWTVLMAALRRSILAAWGWEMALRTWSTASCCGSAP